MATTSVQDLSGIAATLPEYRDIARQQEMAKALIEKSREQPQGQMVSGHYVANPWQSFANVYLGYKGEKLAKEADEKHLKMAEALRREGAQDLAEAMKIGQGYTKEIPLHGPMQTDEQGQAIPLGNRQEEVAGNPLGGALRLSQSRLPSNQTLAQEYLKGMKLGEGEQYVSPIFGARKGGEKLTDDQREYAAALMQGYQGSLQDWILAKRKASASQVNVSTGVPAKTAIQTKQGENLIAESKTLAGASSQIQRLQAAEDLVPQTYAGGFAEAKTEVVKALTSAGINIDQEKLNKATNTQILGSLLFDSVLENLRKVDAQPTQQQQEALQQALGQVTNDPRALMTVLNLTRERLIQRVDAHNQNVTAAEQNLGKGTFAYPASVKIENVHRMDQADRRAYNAALKAPNNPDAQQVLMVLKEKYGNR